MILMLDYPVCPNGPFLPRFLQTSGEEASEEASEEARGSLTALLTSDPGNLKEFLPALVSH